MVKAMKRIAELRKSAGLNQVGLALKLNVSQKMVSAYETGTHQPSTEILLKLSKIFNVSVDYIIGNSEIKATAEKFSASGLTNSEVELLDLFKKLDREEQAKAIGIVFALLNYEK
ncbi:MAG: helix-turn-helix transcriptional regulator [Clostridia bacterium]|nr:helix-turn-helix transcriptional regulator [Clostridia bacterium]